MKRPNRIKNGLVIGSVAGIVVLLFQVGWWYFWNKTEFGIKQRVEDEYKILKEIQYKKGKEEGFWESYADRQARYEQDMKSLEKWRKEIDESKKKTQP